MNKPTRQIARKQPAQPARTARRAASNGKSPSKLVPRLSQITKSLDVIAPEDCFASVILKQLDHDRVGYYAVWLVVGRYEQEALQVHYKFTGEHTVRCDVPNGVSLTISTLQPYLAKFLKGQPTLSDDPPTIIVKGHPNR